jgi:hypothetical protein
MGFCRFISAVVLGLIDEKGGGKLCHLLQSPFRMFKSSVGR